MYQGSSQEKYSSDSYDVLLELLKMSSVAKPADLRKLSVNTSRAQWTKFVSMAFGDHLYWLLVIPKITKEDIILVIDNSGGLVTSLLAEQVKKVLYLPVGRYSRNSKDVLRNFQNVEEMPSNICEWESRDITGCVLVKQGIENPESQKSIDHWLSKNCSDLKWFVCFHRDRSFFKQKKIGFENLELKLEMVAEYQIEAELLPTPDYQLVTNLARRWLVSKPYTRFKFLIKNSTMGRYLWSEKLNIYQEKMTESWILAILKKELAIPSELIRVNRIILGNQGVIIVMLALDNILYVARCGKNEQAKQCIDVNIGALRSLDRLGLPCEAPELKYVVKADPWYISIESKSPGYELYNTFEDSSEQNYFEALLVWKQYQNKGKRESVVDETIWKIVAGDNLKKLEVFCSSDEINMLHNLSDMLKKRLIGYKIILVPTHGDLKLGNLLFDRSEKLVSIIDWDMYSDSQHPLHDILVFEYFHSSKKLGKDIVDYYIENVLSGKTSCVFNKLTTIYLEEFKCQKEQLLALKICSWISVVANHFNWDVMIYNDLANKVLGDSIRASISALSNTALTKYNEENFSTNVFKCGS